MPEITKVKRQKDEKRVNVYLDGKFAFGISLEAVLKHGLEKGKIVSQEFIDNLRDEAEEGKVYNHVLRFATLRPRSEKEIKLWFRRKKVLPAVGEAVFNRLKNLDLVDDEKFAKWWAEQRAEFRQKSRRMLSMELRQKGVSRDVIEKVLAEVDIPDEIALARKAAEKKLRTLRGDFEEQRKKLSEFLARRGFNWSTIKQVIDELVRP